MTEFTSQTAAPTSFLSILDENKKRISEIKQYEEKPVSKLPRNLTFIALTLIALFFIGLFALQIIQGIMALVFTIIMIISLIAGYRILKTMDPVFRQKLKNLQLKKMYEEARANAVEQLDNRIITNQQRLAEAQKARNKMGALVESLKSEVQKTDPSNTYYATKVNTLKRVEKAYNVVCINIKKGAEAYNKFEKKVGEYKQMEKFAQIAGDAMAMFNSSGASKMEELLSLEAFEAIEDNFHGALVSIENAASDMELANDLAA